MSLKRYVPTSPGMIPCTSGGDWVKYEDAMDELSRVEAALKHALNELQEFSINDGVTDLPQAIANMRKLYRKVADEREQAEAERDRLKAKLSRIHEIAVQYHRYYGGYTEIEKLADPGEGAEPPNPFSKGYKHRHGESVSDACGDNKHSECTQDYTKCHCTVRGGHTTPHAYMNIPILVDEQKGEPDGK